MITGIESREEEKEGEEEGREAVRGGGVSGFKVTLILPVNYKAAVGEGLN